MTRQIRILGLIVVSLFFIQNVSSSKLDRIENAFKTREERSVFSIIKFPNDACEGSGNRNGTCYTSRECEAKGGTNSGTCAEGYGVCCTFTGGCGSKFSENCTYFEGSGNMAGDCRFEVCKCQTNICQLRLDFLMFSIAGPNRESVAALQTLNGIGLQASGNGVDVSRRSQCDTDMFSVSSPGNQAPPVVCGNLMDEHMYVDASDGCNQLDFLFGNSANNMNVNRQFNIKITQYSCDYDNLAPKGCTQYFFGSDTGTVRTFNYAGDQHLANQDQKICVRAERGNCRICWFADNADEDFNVSGPHAGTMGYNRADQGCCSYGATGTGAMGYDCAFIPGARTKDHAINANIGSQFCGNRLASSNAMGAGTVCSERAPFYIRFVSDNYEIATDAAAEAGMDNKGFELVFQQEDNCT